MAGDDWLVIILANTRAELKDVWRRKLLQGETEQQEKVGVRIVSGGECSLACVYVCVFRG